MSSKHQRNLHGLLKQPWKAFGGVSKPATKLPNNSKMEDASPRRPARPLSTPAREPAIDEGAPRVSHVSSATKRFEALNNWASDDLGSKSCTPPGPLSSAPNEPSKKKRPFKKAQKFLSSLVRGESSLRIAHHCQAHQAATQWKLRCCETDIPLVSSVCVVAMVPLPMQISSFPEGI